MQEMDCGRRYTIMLREAHDIDSLILPMETVKSQEFSLKSQFSGDFGPKRASARSQVAVCRGAKKRNAKGNCRVRTKPYFFYLESGFVGITEKADL